MMINPEHQADDINKRRLLKKLEQQKKKHLATCLKNRQKRKNK